MAISDNTIKGKAVSHETEDKKKNREERLAHSLHNLKALSNERLE